MTHEVSITAHQITNGDWVLKVFDSDKDTYGIHMVTPGGSTEFVVPTLEQGIELASKWLGIK